MRPRTGCSVGVAQAAMRCSAGSRSWCSDIRKQSRIRAPAHAPASAVFQRRRAPARRRSISTATCIPAAACLDEATRIADAGLSLSATELRSAQLCGFQTTGECLMPYPFKLPDLPYAFNALEPHIDARTMEIHHGKHHAAYTNKLNEALEKHPQLQSKSVEDLLRSIDSVPDDIRTAVRNNGGGYVNHAMFWEIMGPGGGGEPSGALADAIRKK